ncbi:putative metal-dependent peptidase [Halospina denitrificans]|uniref:Putative metal-dependent peptidase n=1 Tax=Halospina denitrificans TaxID=332522 RepID=A0A4R7K2E1_9GAMM|nr:VWA-like domain-containing protein [Halospina denitrificans]TDT44564.1 putative metal-dependent peptidase [Halospina denitrificans]
MSSEATPLPQGTLTEADQALKKRMLKQCEDERLVLLTLQPFTAKLLMNLNLQPVVDDRLPTAGTDGETLFFNAEFMQRRSEEDQRFILAHEVWHCALGHFRRQLGRDHNRWNRATDYEINQLLKEMLGHCPDNALFDAEFAGESAETIYTRLEADPRRNQGNTLDEHDLIKIHAHSAGPKLDPGFAPRAPHHSDADRWRQRLISTAQQSRSGYGDLPGALKIYVNKIRNPTVDWRTRLLRFVQRTAQGEYNWSRPNRRHIHRGIYLPSRQGEAINLAVGIDASGSCVAQVPQFLSELHAILKSFERVTLRVLTFDTDIRRDEVLTEQDLHRLKHWKVEAGGGTNFMPVFEALEKEPPGALVLFSDGYGPRLNHRPAFSVQWMNIGSGSR